MGTKANISVSLVISVLLIVSLGTATAGTIYVDANATLGGDGTTWGTAYKYLQDALYKPPTSGDEIWVAEGTYKPDQDEGGNVTPSDRMATFELKDDVSVYGGFPIGGGTWEERDPNLNETILSGDLNGDDGPDFLNNTENSFTVISVESTTSTAVLDGFLITAGNANDDTFQSLNAGVGGGIFVYPGSNFKINKCVLVENFACDGGGIWLEETTSTVISSCKFAYNKTGNYKFNGGAGLYILHCNPVIIDCLFLRNIVNCNNINGGGGAIFVYSFGGWPEDEIYSNPTIIGTEFIGNKVTSANGGAIKFRGECHANIINCSFIGNSAVDGGAIYEVPFFQNVYADYRNCSIVKNIAGSNGGGIDASRDDASNSTLTNCIVWGNEDSSGTGESAQIQEGFTPGRVSVNYSCIQDDDPDDGYIPFGGAVNNNIDDNPRFARDPNDGGDGWGVGDNDDFGNLRLQYMSPCVDTADNTSVPSDSEDLDDDGNTTEPIPYDLDRHPRIVDGDCNTTEIVDMGAYEFSYTYLGDFAGGCDVDFTDFAVFALAWLTEEGQAGYDSNCDIALPYNGAIDEKDLNIFTYNWLLGR